MQQRLIDIGFSEDLWRLHLGRRKAMAWNSDTGNVGWEACSDPFCKGPEVALDVLDSD